MFVFYVINFISEVPIMKKEINLNHRQAQILEFIETQESVSVNSLIDSMQASAATIRKDLAYLESLGLIRRTRGEAHIQNKTHMPFIPFPLRSQSNVKEKKAIAKRAVEFINDGDTIILDDGTTTLEIANLLDSFHNLTVITHSFDIANILCGNPNISVIVPGGILTHETRSLLGPYTESFYSTIEANKFFLSATGVRRQTGLTVTSPLEVSVKTNAIHASKHVIAVFDASKWEQTAMSLCAPFQDLDVIITNNSIHIDEEMKNILSDCNVELVLVNN